MVQQVLGKQAPSVEEIALLFRKLDVECTGTGIFYNNYLNIYLIFLFMFSHLG